MTAVAFDAFKMIQALRRKNSFSAEQAEALASAFSDAVTGDLATASDLELARTDLQKTIELTRTDLLRTIAETKGDILKWTFGAIGFQTLVIVGAILALARR